MKLKTNIFLFTVVLASFVLGACGSTEAGTSSAVLTEAAIIYSESLTQTAAVAPPTATATVASPTPTNTTAPTFTPTVTGTPPTATPAAATATPSTGGATGGTSGNAPCLRASFEIETIDDGTEFYVGTLFTKTWRLKNTGTCTWTAGFNAVWVQGELFGADSVTPFTDKDIPPGGYALISINMKAPGPAGHYKGYWMLRSNDGVFFGVGTGGKEWFWVDIQTKAVPDQ